MIVTSCASRLAGPSFPADTILTEAAPRPTHIRPRTKKRARQPPERVRWPTGSVLQLMGLRRDPIRLPQLQLVTRTALADAVTAAVELNGRALQIQTGYFGTAESGILRCSLSYGEVAILNVRGPGTNRGCGDQF